MSARRFGAVALLLSKTSLFNNEVISVSSVLSDETSFFKVVTWISRSTLDVDVITS